MGILTVSFQGTIVFLATAVSHLILFYKEVDYFGGRGRGTEMGGGGIKNELF